MPFIDLTPAPIAPQRDDPPEVFIERADDFVAWMEDFTGELNTFISQLEAAAALIAAAPAYADPALSAMTGNTPAADQFIYFTGSSSSAMTSITAIARNLLDDATAGAMLTTLGVTAFMQTVLDDADAPTARATLGAAALGPNDDITSMLQSATIAETGTIAANSLGFRGVPGSGQTQGAEITLALAGAGKTVPNTLGGWRIPANSAVAFPLYTAIVLYNDSATAQTVNINTDTLRIGATDTTGAIDVLPYGVATIVKMKATEWVISGHIG